MEARRSPAPAPPSPTPIYTKWFDAYAKETGVRINYQSIGSGGGIRQFTEGTVDFGATDGPMTDEQIAAVKGNVLHVPTVLGAVVRHLQPAALGKTRAQASTAPRSPTSSSAGSPSGTTRASPRSTPASSLPAEDIIVVHRSDGSGTTFIFTDYLSKVSPEWKAKVGKATSVNWPIGLGGKGNEGVTQQVKQSEGAIGYVELIYAISNDLPYAECKNAAGEFVEPSLKSVTAAAAGAELTPDTDFRVSITNAPGPEAYPISSFTWLLVQNDSRATAPRHERSRIPDLDARARGPAHGGRPALRAAAGAGDRAGRRNGSGSSSRSGPRDLSVTNAVTDRDRGAGKLPP